MLRESIIEDLKFTLEKAKIYLTAYQLDHLHDWVDVTIKTIQQQVSVEPVVKPACEIDGRIKEAEYWRDIIFSPEQQERKQTISLTDFIMRIEELKLNNKSV